MHKCPTCSWGGKGPGSILLAEEHIFGKCLSRQQHTQRPVGPSSAAAWPLYLQLTRGQLVPHLLQPGLSLFS